MEKCIELFEYCRGYSCPVVDEFENLLGKMANAPDYITIVN